VFSCAKLWSSEKPRAFGSRSKWASVQERLGSLDYVYLPTLLPVGVETTYLQCNHIEEHYCEQDIASEIQCLDWLGAVSSRKKSWYINCPLRRIEVSQINSCLPAETPVLLNHRKSSPPDIEMMLVITRSIASLDSGSRCALGVALPLREKKSSDPPRISGLLTTKLNRHGYWISDSAWGVTIIPDQAVTCTEHANGREKSP
jgi:hypothetical protein